MNRKINWLLSGLLLAGIAGLGMTSCGEAEEAYNCAEICETYSDCAGNLGVDIDVTACVNDCEDESDRSEDFKQDAEECQVCLDANESCAENIPCAGACAGVVPEL
jgi:hypothetical protein